MVFLRSFSVLLALLGVTLPFTGQSSQIAPASQISPEPFGRRGHVFEPNLGQADPDVRFVYRGNGHSLLLSDRDAVLKFANSPASIRMKLVGQRSARAPEGLEPKAGVTHYFTGNDATQWLRSVPQFGKVKYANVYPGIDLIYYGDGRELEYDFVLAPHAEPGRIQVDFEGAEQAELDANGDLVLRTKDGGEIRHRRPVAYQERDGNRESVEASFVLSDKRVSFKLGKYDAQLPLIVDPKFVWASFLGGAGDDLGTDIALDSEGNVFVTGLTQSADVSSGVLQPGPGKGFQAFVTKIDPNGAIVYSAYFGGSGADEGHAVGVDAAGSVYVTGYTTSSDFPIVNGFQTKIGGAQDSYLLKLSSDGRAIQYSTYIGGVAGDRGFGIAVAPSGDAYVAGNTLSTTGFPILNAFQSSMGGGLADAFLTKVSADGKLGFSTFLGGNGNDQAYDVVRDDDGNLILTGFTTSQNFPLSNAVMGSYRGGADDVFVTKFNPAGSALVFSTYWGGSGSDNGVRLAVDGDKNIYFTGYTTSVDFPRKNPPQLLLNGTYDAFLVKLHADGQDADFSTYIGGEDTEGGVSVAVDKKGFIYVTGFTNSLQFYAINALGGFLRGLRDGFLLKMTPDASTVIYSSYLGGFGLDGGTSVIVDDDGNAYVTGYTSSSDFPKAANAFQGDTAGGQDGFIVKVNADDIRSSSAYQFPANGGVTVATAGQTAQPIFGYAAADVNSGLSPSGLAVIDLRSSGTLVNELAVPAPRLTSNGRLLVRTAFSDATAISMINPGEDEVEVSFLFTSTEGVPDFYGSFRLPAKAHLSSLLTSDPFNFPSDLTGTFTFTSTGPVAAVALRVDTSAANPVNTHVPIFNPYEVHARTQTLPHFVDGGGWSTLFYLINPTEAEVSGEVRLFKNGEPGQRGVQAEIATERGISSVFAFTIAPRGLFTLIGRGESADTISGFAEIVPAEGSNAPFAHATLLFNGSGIAATTVEAIDPASTFTMYVESTGTFPEDLAARPALAVANSSETPATITFTLTGFDGTDSGLSGSITLPPKSHFGNFVTTIPGFENLPSPFYGVLKAVTSNPGVTFVGFRMRYNEQRTLLLLTTGPLKDLGNANPIYFPHVVDGGGYATQFILVGPVGAGAGGALRFLNPSGGSLNLAIAPQ
jgi:hypothetical protein